MDRNVAALSLLPKARKHFFWLVNLLSISLRAASMLVKAKLLMLAELIEFLKNPFIIFCCGGDCVDLEKG